MLVFGCVYTPGKVVPSKATNSKANENKWSSRDSASTERIKPGKRRKRRKKRKKKRETRKKLNKDKEKKEKTDTKSYTLHAWYQPSRSLLTWQSVLVASNSMWTLKLCSIFHPLEQAVPFLSDGRHACSRRRHLALDLSSEEQSSFTASCTLWKAASWFGVWFVQVVAIA